MTIDVPATAREVLTSARMAGVGEDDDIGRLLVGMMHIATALDAKMAEIQAKPVAEIERVILKTMHRLKPDIVSTWTWRRRAWMSCAFGCPALVLLCAMFIMGYRIGWDGGGAESARWGAWCSDRSHISTQGAATVCIVPVGTAAR